MNNELGLNFQTAEYEIIGKEMLIDDVVLLKIKGRLDFQPGQFVEMTMPHFGNITMAPCSSPKNKRAFELCVRGVGSTSNALVKLLPGDKISLRGPYGHGWPTDKFQSHNIVVIAGGMGIVPLRPILLDVENKFHFGKISLFAGFKKPEDVIFETDLKRWKKKFKVHATVEQISLGSARQADHKFWGGRGLIIESLETATLDKKSIVLMCGPEAMYHHCAQVLAQKGIIERQIYVSLERRMECGIGLCQHCSCGKYLVCTDGPVFRLDKIKNELNK